MTALATLVSFGASLLVGLAVLSAQVRGGPDLPFEDTYWRAVAVDGKPLDQPSTAREAHLVFRAGSRVTGATGCNRLSGQYTVDGNALRFGQLVSTQVSCGLLRDVEERFRAALDHVRTWRIIGTRLEFVDERGAVTVAFEGQTTSAAADTMELAGTAWQLVRYQRADGTSLEIRERSSYTIEFFADGRLTARIDCNRGRGSWKTIGHGGIELGPLALTRALCPAASLHDRLVADWQTVRGYTLRDGRLILTLEGPGLYEFEALPKAD